MIQTIENEFLRAAISSSGAELQSIINKQNNREYLWQGDAAFWPRRAPVLFPVVGKLNNNSCRTEGNSYTLSQHGFARDSEFAIAGEGKSGVSFILKSGEETRRVFPYDFDLKISYGLEGKKLTTAYEVVNKNRGKMYFSIGGHPGFVCPFNTAESLSDYFLEFEKVESLERHLLDDGVFNGKTEPVVKHEKILPLNEDLFKKDALVFKHMASSFMVLKSGKSDYALKFSFSGFPYFGIWKKANAPFICLEPWCGIADNKGFSGELMAKEGIVCLPEGEVFHRQYSVEIL